MAQFLELQNSMLIWGIVLRMAKFYAYLGHSILELENPVIIWGIVLRIANFYSYFGHILYSLYSSGKNPN